VFGTDRHRYPRGVARLVSEFASRLDPLAGVGLEGVEDDRFVLDGVLPPPCAGWPGWWGRSRARRSFESKGRSLGPSTRDREVGSTPVVVGHSSVPDDDVLSYVGAADSTPSAITTFATPLATARQVATTWPPTATASTLIPQGGTQQPTTEE
jgi:hypothetical protein